MTMNFIMGDNTVDENVSRCHKREARVEGNMGEHGGRHAAVASTCMRCASAEQLPRAGSERLAKAAAAKERGNQSKTPS